MKEKPVPARILLVEDHAIMRDGLRALIEGENEMEVCGEAATGEEAFSEVQRRKPDLVILDLSLKQTHGMDLLKKLNERHPGIRVLVLSMHDEKLYAERALNAGAMGYIMKEADIQTLRAAIRQVLGGKVYVSGEMAEVLLGSFLGGRKERPGPSLEQLSDRELEVFELTGRGLATKEIAKRMHASVKTVESYRARIKEKLGIRDHSELVQRAVHWTREL